MRIGIAAAILFAGAVTGAYADGVDAADDAEAPIAALPAADYLFDHVSCTGGKNEIRIVITDVKKSVGLMTVDLYPNDDEKFLRGAGRITQVRFAAKSPVTKFCVDAPESGFFAMSAYHDESPPRAASR
jgi:hypothetical protein